jgi:tripeptide aminopeptidase
VVAAAAAVEAAGGRPEYRIADGGLDANSLTARGLPTVTLGVGQRNAHTVKETLELDDFELACRVVLRLATGAETTAAS